MKKILKVTGIIFIVIILGVSTLALYVKKGLPNVGAAPELKVEITPERIARGEYLAVDVMACMDCHSKRDWSIFGAPIAAGTFGGGGEKFGKEMGFPGTLYSRNITPYALGNWTDGEIFRAITSGVNKDGKAIFPMMGYLNYGKMDPEDVYSIIAYLRKLPPVKNEVPESELDFPLNFIVNTFPEKAALQSMPDKKDEVAYGGYLVSIANCLECHSKVNDKGERIAGTEFGGGRAFNFPNGIVVTSANISPDKATGIGDWSKEAFIQKFKQFSDSSYSLQKVGPTDFNTPMPWFMYTGMDTSDLSAIYKYLRSVKEVNHTVKKFVKL